MPFNLPPALTTPLRCDANLRNFVKRGPRSASGREQRVYSDAGYMTITYQWRLRTPQQVRAYRRMIARLRTGEEMYAQLFERSAPSSALVDGAEAEFKLAGSLRDTQITMYATGVNVQEGSYIGIANRLHLITQIVSGPESADLFNPVSNDVPWDDGAPWSDGNPNQQTWVVKVLPPLRSGYDVGTAIKFTGITLVGVIEDPAQGDTDLDLIKRGAVSLTIIESI